MISIYFDSKIRRWCADYGTHKRYFASEFAARKFVYGYRAG